MYLDRTTKELVALALSEDIGPGDITANLVPKETRARANILAKQELVLAGVDVFAEVFRQIEPSVLVSFVRTEGTKVEPGAIMGAVSGPARAVLMGERTALNFLQRLSGIATFTRKCADAVVGTHARVVDTRKTTPGMRALEKHAVRVGGAMNHRFSLHDGVLIKDNHIAAIGSVSAAIHEARAIAHHLLRVECEVTTLAQLEEAIEAGADVVLLDNMSLGDIEEAVRINRGRVLLEASGNMSLERLPMVAATGVDYISMGALTHTVRAADISLDFET